jgi:hypothetical protein
VLKNLLRGVRLTYAMEGSKAAGGGGPVMITPPQGSFGRNIDPPSEYQELCPDTRAEVLLWIWRNLKPTKAKVYPGTSYGLKHAFEDDAGTYISNGAFKGAMLEAGYLPVDRRERNWRFRCAWTRGKARAV